MSSELNEAVWRALGWRATKGGGHWHHPEDGALWMTEHLPRYATSLDACAELRAGLSEEERLMFALMLAEIVREAPGTDGMNWLIASATAEQHCRAFLAAKGTK